MQEDYLIWPRPIITTPPLNAPGNTRFIVYSVGRFLLALAAQVETVAVGWQVYTITNSTLALGYCGLAVFVPYCLLTLPAGDLADRFDRRRLVVISGFLQAITSALFLTFTLTGLKEVGYFYAALALSGAGRALMGPSMESLLPRLVIGGIGLEKAIAWSSSTFQVAVITGPALGGLLYIYGPAVTYSLGLIGFLGASVAMMALPLAPEARRAVVGGAWERLVEGVAYVVNRKVIFGAITLDLFAVLLGGSVALLPVYARDILHTGPEGFGLLRSAPAIGAVMVGLTLSRYPIKRHTGPTLFACVAGFGAATIVFGVSTSFVLSLLMLVMMGATDMVSVWLRQTLAQRATPDAMRGRVSAVNRLFIGASNELGEFESGTTAAWFGTVPAVVIGGIGTIVVVGLCAWMFPALRRVDRLTDVGPNS